MPQKAKPGYGIEWKSVRLPNGGRTRIYTRKCNWCNEYYEGRGKSFCGKSCATKWGRATKDYSKAIGKKGVKRSVETKKKLSEIMKERWRKGEFTGTTFNSKETKLEKYIRELLERKSFKFKQKYWINIKNWRPKEYDFFLPTYNLLIEVDGEYWHSLPENIKNDKYKNELAKKAGYNLMRISEYFIKEDLAEESFQLVLEEIKEIKEKEDLPGLFIS